MDRPKDRKWRVGALVAISLMVLAVSILIIGKQRSLFRSKAGYFALFENVTGLGQGNPVRLNGVVVGQVKDVVLSEDVADRKIRVEFEVDNRFSGRIRTDSKARIKTLGLLGDKYIDISLGSPQAKELPEDSEIPAISPANLEKLFEGGEDAVDNIVQISASLRNILQRIDRGDGLIGQLTRGDAPKGPGTIGGAVASVQALVDDVRNGPGLAHRLIYDPQYDARISGSLANALESLERVVVKVDQGEGAIPVLLNDPATRDRIVGLVAALHDASVGLNQAVVELNTGKGAIPRLLHDDEFADQFIGDLRSISSRLNNVAKKLDEGYGTAGKLVNDTSLYEAVNDIIVGLNESKILRYLIRRSQKKGIAKRGKDAGYPGGAAESGDDEGEASPVESTPEAPPAAPPDAPPSAAPASPKGFTPVSPAPADPSPDTAASTEG